MRKPSPARSVLLALCALVAGCQTAAPSSSPRTGTAGSTVAGRQSPPHGSRASSSPSSVPSPQRPCGYRVAKPSYDHVMWIWMENESLVSIVGAPDAPYATNLAHRCGLAVDYFAITPRPCPTTSLPPAGRPRA